MGLFTMRNQHKKEHESYASIPIVHFIDDFKHFVLKKNAIDMALGITIGISFGKVISSLVNDIIMPPLALVVGGVNLADLKLILKKTVTNSAHQVVSPEVSIFYGKFIQIGLDFLIVAFSAFLVIKIVNNLMRTKEQADIDWTEYLKK